MRRRDWLATLRRSCVSHRKPAAGTRPLRLLRSRGLCRLEAFEPRLMLAADFGDAPDTGAGTGTGNYQTLQSDNGPSHIIDDTSLTLFLGSVVDGDNGFLQDAGASADDIDGALPDDERGILIPNDLYGAIGTSPVITLVATNTTGSAATLHGWIDYDQNGVFDSAMEGASVVVPDGTAAGNAVLSFPEIPDGSAGMTYARFRLSTDSAAANPTGPASDGEVEDYPYTIGVERIDRFGSAVAQIDIVTAPTVGVVADNPDFYPENGEFRPADGASLTFAGPFSEITVTDLELKVVPGTMTEQETFGDVEVVTANVLLTGRSKSTSAFGGDDYDFFVLTGVAQFVLIGKAGNTTGTFNADLITLDASGLTGDGVDIRVTNSFSLPSLGEVTITDLGGGQFLIDSHFDVFTELSIESGAPVPASSSIELELIQPGTKETIVLSGPTDVATRYEGPSEGDATDDDPNGRDEIPTELIGLNLTGSSSFGPVTLQTSGERRSFGEIEEQANNTPGTLDVTPYEPGSGDATFDVFLELDLSGQLLHTEMPKNLYDEINGIPFGDDTAFFGGGSNQLFDFDGNPTGITLGDITFVPEFNSALDFGDAPDLMPGTVDFDYQTRLADDGPRHAINPDVLLGASIDADTGFLADASAAADDLEGGLPGDEDGVLIPEDLLGTEGASPTVALLVTNATFMPATLFGWIDYN